MITVNQFKISNDRKTISLQTTVAVGQVLNRLVLWTEDTYKSSSLLKDLTSKISGADETEAITITALDAGVDSFDGLYIIELGSDDVTDVPGIVATISLTRFYGIMAQLLANVNLSCLNCNDNFQNSLLLDLYLQGIINALTLGRFRDAINFLKKINIFAEFNCAECVNISPVVSSAGNIVSIGVIDCVLNSED